MARPNAFIKMSGNLLDKKEVIEWLSNLSRQYFLVICIGGGEQINKAFTENGFDIKFGPIGRITESLEERQLARDVLEKNQAITQDLINDHEINARVIIPVDDVATVLCHVNGDIKALSVYNGYDKIFFLTLKDRVEKKNAWVRKIAELFETESGLSKIEIVGF